MNKCSIEILDEDFEDIAEVDSKLKVAEQMNGKNNTTIII